MAHNIDHFGHQRKLDAAARTNLGTPHPRTTAAQPHLSKSAIEEKRRNKVAQLKKAQKTARYKKDLAKSLKSKRAKQLAKTAVRSAARGVGGSVALTGLGSYYGTKKLLDVTGGTKALEKVGRKIYSATHKNKKKKR